MSTPRMVFTINVINHSNIEINCAYEPGLSENQMLQIGNAFAPALEACLHLAKDLAGDDEVDIPPFKLADREVGFHCTVHGDKIAYPWVVAAIITAFKLAAFDVLGQMLRATIYIDQILTPSDVEDWSKKILSKLQE